MTITILQTLASLIFVGVGIEMANKPPATDKERWIYRGIFIFIGLFLLVLAWVQYTADETEKTESKMQANRQAGKIQDLNNNQTNLEQTFKTKFDALQSNQLVFQAEQLSIQMAMAINPAYSPALRERIIASDEKYQAINLQSDDLKAWIDGYINEVRDRQASAEIQREKDLVQEQSSYQELFPYIDYAVTSLTNILKKIADKKGYEIDTNFNFSGTPTTITKADFTIAEIKYKNNPDWDFKITWSSDLAMRIINVDSMFWINDRHIGSVYVPNLPNDDFNFSTNDYKKIIDERLKPLVGYRLYKSSPTN